MADNNLVDLVMTQMEQNNGSYNEDMGAFKSDNNNNNNMSQLQKKFIVIINEDSKMQHILETIPKSKDVINTILGNDDLLADLIEHYNMIPDFVMDALNQTDNATDSEHLILETETKLNTQHNLGESEQIQNEIDNVQSIDQDPNQNMQVNIDKTNYPKSSDFNWITILIGPIIASICFFIVSYTPAMFYAGQIPYIGSYLLNFKVITSIVLVAILHLILSVVANYVMEP